MTEIRLTRLQIRNFKGIRELDILLDGKDMNVLGDNGTGKTTIIDSFTWLLFGKDSLDRADFGIKPTDSAGNIIHQLETSVEAIFDISGETRVFKKTLTEVWTRRRGAPEAEFTRNENNFYIDGIPKKKSEYEAAIRQLIDEKVFKIITNPLYFNEAVNWKDRRSVLLAICGDVSDEDVIASKAELMPLLPLLQGKSVADFKDIAASTMKRVNQELDIIPARIAEAERAKPSGNALVVDHARKEQLTQEIEGLRAKKIGIQNGAEVTRKRLEAESLKIAFRSIGKEFNPDWTPEAAEVKRITEDIRTHESLLKGLEGNLYHLRNMIEQKKIERERYSKEWDEVFAVRFTDITCPTCHRELPEDEVYARRIEFNSRKAQRLDEIEKQNEKIGLEIKALEDEIITDSNNVTETKAMLELLKEKLPAAKSALAALVESKEKEFTEARLKLRAEIAEIESQIKRFEEGSGESVAEIERQIISLSRELSVINEAIANNTLLERQEKRIAELREQQARLATEYTAAERHLYLAEQFTIAKVNMLNERINQKFKYAKFKLFDKQINGGINEVCEVTYDGIPYKDLNNAMRINIGLDIINTISEHYGVTCPIMIDNAESVNTIYPTKAQQICFYVSKDEELVFEN